eukprot:5474343-Pleurochrysis_carterae.AAC.1
MPAMMTEHEQRPARTTNLHTPSSGSLLKQTGLVKHQVVSSHPIGASLVVVGHHARAVERHPIRPADEGA